MVEKDNNLTQNKRTFRLGIDFGYAYTGIALLDSKNKVLDFKVLKHRTDISKTLEKRRGNRAQRRRKLSKIRRLRDFYSLLKGMGIEPKNARPGDHATEREKASLGNRLYALAHYRGWDYASLLDHLITYPEDKAPKRPPIIKEIDQMLVQEFQAPCDFNEQGRRKHKNESPADYTKAQENAKKEFDKKNTENNLRFSDKTIPFIEIKTTCLGELYEKACKLHDLKKKLEKNPSLEQEVSEQESSYENLRAKLENAELDDIDQWIKDRLKAVWQSKSPVKKDDIVLRILTRLGLQAGERLFDKGKIYRPHRNRHRNEMLSDLESLMKVACGSADTTIFERELNNTYKRLSKSKFNQKKTIFSEKDITKDWEEQIALVCQKADEISRHIQSKGKTQISSQEIKEAWIKSAKKILNREYRKKRFDNRNSMGKCPALADKGIRCGKNVPKKAKEEIRKWQFEIELRQMNVRRADEREEKLNDGEIKKLMDKMAFKTKMDEPTKRSNREAIKNFFTTKEGDRYIPPAKNKARGKKDILRDIACGEQAGRAVFCKSHLEKKLHLIKAGETQSKNWARLHEERILNLQDSAPPSVRQKVQKTVKLIRKMLRRAGADYSQIEHIGIETARFDISSLAQAEGKKLKKSPKRYQESAGGDKASLREDQGDQCLFCGESLIADAHIDHLFPKIKGGGNIILNKVIGHSICNINKHKYKAPLNREVLAVIQKNNPKKYNFIQKRLESNGGLPEDMLSVPQHTMFGSKLLKGALIEELGFSKDKTNSIFPTIGGKEVSCLRSFWFPFMHWQKTAIRKKSQYKVNADELYSLKLKKQSATIPFKKASLNRKEKSLKELKLDPELFDGELSFCRIDNRGEKWLAIKKDESIDKSLKKENIDLKKKNPFDYKITGTPKKENIGLNRFALRNDKSDKFFLELVKFEQDKDKKQKSLYNKIFKINKEVKIPLKDLLSKDKKIIKLLKYPNTNIKIEFSKKDKKSGQDWLKIERGNLIGIPEISYRENNTAYIPWADLSFINNSKNFIEKLRIKTHIAEKVIPITVEPKKDDSIREFHHALDAVILASKADWGMIGRLNRDMRERSYNERIKMYSQARQKNAPQFEILSSDKEGLRSCKLRKDNKGNLLAPVKFNNWYIEDKQNQRKLEFSKTNTEPLRIIKDKPMKKEPLEKIARKNIKKIQSKKIKKALEQAWEEIDKLKDEEKKLYTEGKGQEQKILQDWFLKCPKEHILHPKNTRSVLCETGGAGTKQLYIRQDKKTEGKHYFKREVSWAEVWIIKDINKKSKEKTEAIRIAPKFYWKDKSQSRPNHNRNETDKPFPEKYKILRKFKAHDIVKIKDVDGKWKITKLGDQATVENIKTLEKNLFLG